MRHAVLTGCFALLTAAAGGQRAAQWEQIETPVRESFGRVQVDETGGVWILGDRIHQRRADGTSDLHSITGSGEVVWVAGASGTLLRLRPPGAPIVSRGR